MYGGRIYPIVNMKTIEVQEFDDIDNRMTTQYKQVEQGNKYYALVITAEKELTEGMTPIKDYIYDMQIYKIYLMYQFLKSMGINPVGIKTDSILIRETQPQLNKKATISNITSELFSIKTTQEVNEVKQTKKNCKQYLSAEQIKYILLELRKHKSFTNDDLGDILVHANCRSKQIETVMTKIEKNSD